MIPNKGFILLLAYCNNDRSTDTYSNAWDAGHAVTLVNAMPDMLLIHDPAHDDDETGTQNSHAASAYQWNMGLQGQDALRWPGLLDAQRIVAGCSAGMPE